MPRKGTAFLKGHFFPLMFQAYTFFKKRNVYLVQLQGHPESWGNNFVQEVDVCKHPLILGCYSEVTFEEGVEAVQERIQAVKQSRVCSFIRSKGVQAPVTLSWPESPLCHLRKDFTVFRLIDLYHQEEAATEFPFQVMVV